MLHRDTLYTKGLCTSDAPACAAAERPSGGGVCRRPSLARCVRQGEQRAVLSASDGRAGVGRKADGVEVAGEDARPDATAPRCIAACAGGARCRAHAWRQHSGALCRLHADSALLTGEAIEVHPTAAGDSIRVYPDDTAVRAVHQNAMALAPFVRAALEGECCASCPRVEATEVLGGVERAPREAVAAANACMARRLLAWCAQPFMGPHDYAAVHFLASMCTPRAAKAGGSASAWFNALVVSMAHRTTTTLLPHAVLEALAFALQEDMYHRPAVPPPPKRRRHHRLRPGACCAAAGRGAAHRQRHLGCRGDADRHALCVRVSERPRVVQAVEEANVTGCTSFCSVIAQLAVMFRQEPDDAAADEAARNDVVKAVARMLPTREELDVRIRKQEDGCAKAIAEMACVMGSTTLQTALPIK